MRPEEEQNASVWLTWKDHRRSQNIASAFDAEYVVLESRAAYLWRVLVLSVRTTWFLIKRRPRVVYVQNPSQALASLCCWLKPWLRFFLVVDRHSSFKLESVHSRNPKLMLFHWLSRQSVGQADLTIVTNEPLKQMVDEWGGRGAVLPDRLPEMPLTVAWQHQPSQPLVAVFVANFDDEEPWEALFASIRQHEQDWHLYITGNYKRAGFQPPPDLVNVTFTGFLSDAEYIAVLNRSDLVIVLTDDENLLNCGSYEAVQLGKPMVLTGTRAIREYFHAGAIYVDNSAGALSVALDTFVAQKDSLRRDVERLKVELQVSWPQQLEQVRRRIPATGSIQQS